MSQTDRNKVAAALAGMVEPSAIDSPAAPSSGDADDQVIAPRTSAAVFAPRRRTDDLRAERSLNARRTAIPILISCGLLLPAIGSLKWLAGDESIFSMLDLWVPIALAVFGALLLTLAVL